MTPASTLIRCFHNPGGQPARLERGRCASEHPTVDAVRIRHGNKPRCGAACRKIRAWLGLATLVLGAAVALPFFPALASSHDPKPEQFPSGPDAFDALDALGVDPEPSIDSGEFLDPDAAFALSVEMRDAHTIVLRWTLANTYYLYRDRFAFSSASDALELDVPRLPPATRKQDPYFGETEVYYRQVEILLPVKRRPRNATEARLEVQYQGCTDRGLCYPPISKPVTLALPAVE